MVSGRRHLEKRKGLLSNELVMRDNTDQIFGIRATIEAIRSGKEINKVLIRKGLKGELFHELYEEVKEHQIPFQIVPAERFNKISNKNHQGVITLVSPITYYQLEDILPGIFESGKIPFLLMLDKVNDVRNFGAIARTAECSGVDAIIISAKGSASINADAVKTSAGALHHIPVCREKDLKKTIHLLQESGIVVMAATEKAEDLYFKKDLTVPLAVMMGSEEKGIAWDYLRLTDGSLSIPINGNIESLNVSAATAILCYEVVRQRIQ